MTSAQHCTEVAIPQYKEMCYSDWSQMSDTAFICGQHNHLFKKSEGFLKSY